MRERGDEHASLPGFDADTAVEELGGGRFGAEMSERWWVGKGPNGGYVAAVILRAIQASAGGERAPRSLTVHYQRAPLAGPVEIGVEVEREGGRVTFLSARMTQEGKVQATAQAAALGGLERRGRAADRAEARLPGRGGAPRRLRRWIASDGGAASQASATYIGQRLAVEQRARVSVHARSPHWPRTGQAGFAGEPVRRPPITAHSQPSRVSLRRRPGGAPAQLGVEHPGHLAGVARRRRGSAAPIRPAARKP